MITQLSLDPVAVRRFITDTDKTVDAVLTEDYNGGHVITVFYTGIPALIAEVPEPLDHGSWYWTTLEDLNETYLQVHIDLLFEIGELPEEAQQRFVSGVPGEYDALSRRAYDAALDESGDGHEWVAFCGIFEEAFIHYLEGDS